MPLLIRKPRKTIFCAKFSIFLGTIGFIQLWNAFSELGRIQQSLVRFFCCFQIEEEPAHLIEHGICFVIGKIHIL